MRQLILNLFLFILFTTTAFSQAFITTWEVEANGDQITIPTSGSGYNYTVDWGDGGTDENVTGNITHTYAVAGIYTVNITGQFPRILFRFADSRTRIQSVEQWGNQVWTSMESAFEGCSNLVINATDAPDLSGVTDMSAMFRGASSLNQSLNNWDVSNVTNMSSLFLGASSFDQPLDNWDVGNVTNMAGLFRSASSFNQNINTWNVGSVTSMSEMFRDATVFNQDLNSWNVTSVTTMFSMFQRAIAFNGSIGNWSPSSVTNMSQMFWFGFAFNQPIGTWDVSNVTDMSWMFSSASVFNQDLNAWNVSSVTDMSVMFNGADAFYGNITNWNTGNVTQMQSMFRGAGAFNQPIGGWDVSNVTNMREMFRNAISFNQPLASWNTNSVITMEQMFRDAIVFNQNISSWNTETVTILRWMFWGAESYNQPLDSWDVSNVNNMTGLFWNAETFNRPLNSWDVSNVTDMSYMFSGASIFNTAISNWDVGNVTNMTFMFNNADQFNQPLNEWNTGSLTRTFAMFQSADNFNQDLNNWDVSNVTSMQSMFRGAAVFNGNVTTWNTQSVTNMSNMFSNASVFNQDISSWNTSSVTNALALFDDAISFDQNLGNWDISQVSNVFFMLSNSGLSVENYDRTLIGWSALPSLQPDLFLGAGNLFYCTGEAARNDIIATYNWTISDAGLKCPSGEIAVYNGPSITDPEIVNAQTDPVSFDNNFAGGTASRSLTIANEGAVALNITDVSVSGTVFSISVLPSTVVLPGNTTNFEIEQQSAIAGTFTETVTILSDDADAATFTFRIRVEVTENPEPEIMVSIVADNEEIQSGQAAPVDFGSVIQNTDKIVQFSIENVGTADLTIAAINFTGSAFSLASAAPPTLAAGETGFFDVNFRNSALGSYNETITIANNDVNEGSFTFNLTGQIVATLQPDMLVYKDSYNASDEIFNGQTAIVELDTVTEGGNLIERILLDNDGFAILSVTDVIFSGTNFSVPTSLPLSVEVDETEDIFFEIEVNSSIPGVFNETVTIISNDPVNGSFSFPIRAVVTASTNTSPNISSITALSFDEDETSGIINFIISDSESSPEALLVIATSDNNDLINFEGIALGGTGSDRTIQLTPLADANGVAEILVEVTDPEGASNTTSFMITVNPINDAPIITGTSALTTELNTPIDITLTDLTVTDVDNNFPADFTIALNSGDNYTLDGNTVIPATDFSGNLSVPVFVNDGELNSPEANVLISVGTAVFSVAFAGEAVINGGTINFNDVPLGASDLRNLEIINAGAIPLTITAIEIASDDFILQSSAPPSIASGDSAIVSIEFRPTSIGEKSAQLTIVSENANDFVLTLNASGLEELPQLLIYNVVTPLKDGKHDFFKIGNIEFYESNTVEIYNKWGNEVYSVNNYDNEDNNFIGLSKNGEQLATGTYYYVINATGSDTLKGYLVLQR